MEINGGQIVKNEQSENAMGGSELMAYRMVNSIDPVLLKEFQIIHSRVRNLDETKIRVLVCHDLVEDPETEHLANGGWSRFHKLVFVSNWQMQSYVNKYSIPWSRCEVMHNAIEPIRYAQEDKRRDTIRLIYHTTPHRGLHLLVPIFSKLTEELDYITLDVYSSFGVYGWAARDEQFEGLFEACRKHPKINYHGAVTNEHIREILVNKHIYAYPSIWQETSCLSLMEAMSAGLVCVHSNYGALFETAAKWTQMYQYQEDQQLHANIFYSVLKENIISIKNNDEETYQGMIGTQSTYANVFYNWNLRKMQWEALLTGLLNQPRAIEQPQEMFVYRTN